MTLRVERRKPAFASDLLIRVAVAWAMISGLLLATNIAHILSLRSDAANAAGPLDSIYAGWPAPAELPHVAFTGLLTPFAGPDLAASIATIFVPLATFALALLLAARIAWRLIGDEAATLACLAMALSVPVLAAMQPFKADHHGFQIVLALLAMNGLMARTPRRGGWLTGAAFGVWLAISLEALPLVLVFLALAGWRWVACRQDRGWFVYTLQGLTAVAAGLWALGGGLSGIPGACATLSGGHVAAFAVATAGGMLVSAFEPLPRPLVAVGMAMVSGVAAMLFVALAAPCSGFVFGDAVPVWTQSVALALQIVVPPLVALLAAVQLGGRSSDWLRRWWNGYATILVAAFALSIVDVRSAPVAGALAAVPLGWQLREWLRASRHLRVKRKRVMAMAGMALALLPALPLTVAAAV